MGWMTGFELHRTHRRINKINHLALQIAAKPGKKYANLQPVATRNRTLKTRLHPREISHEHSSRPSLSSSFFRLSGRLRATVRHGFPEEAGDLLTALRLLTPFKISYEAAKNRAEPYTKIVEELPEMRRDTVELAQKAVGEKRKAYVLGQHIIL